MLSGGLLLLGFRPCRSTVAANAGTTRPRRLTSSTMIIRVHPSTSARRATTVGGLRGNADSSTVKNAGCGRPPLPIRSGSRRQPRRLPSEDRRQPVAPWHPLLPRAILEATPVDFRGEDAGAGSRVSPRIRVNAGPAWLTELPIIGRGGRFTLSGPPGRSSRSSSNRSGTPGARFYAVSAPGGVDGRPNAFLHFGQGMKRMTSSGTVISVLQ